MSSPAGNRTPVSRVTGGDTDHYTTEDLISFRNFTYMKIISCTISYGFRTIKASKLCGKTSFEIFTRSMNSMCANITSSVGFLTSPTSALLNSMKNKM